MNRAIVLVSFLVVKSTAVFGASPTLFQSCSLNRPPNIGLVLYDTDCKSAYLLPSPAGQMSITGAAINVSTDTCSAVKSLERSALGGFGNSAERDTQRGTLEKRLKIAHDRGAELKESQLTYQTLQSSLAVEISIKEQNVGIARERFLSLCNNNAAKDFNCLSLHDEIEKADAQLKTHFTKKRKVDRLLEDLGKELSAIETDAKALESAIAALRPEFGPADLVKDAKTELNERRKRIGATISVTLRTKLIDELKRVKQANGGTSMVIDQMRFIGGSIHAAGLSKVDDPELSGKPILEMPGSVVEGGGTLFINAASARLTLDEVTACQVFAYKRPETTNLQGIANAVSGNISAKAYLRYKALLGVKAKVSMNYVKFYEYLSKRESRNGFFKTSTIHEVSETLRGESALSTELTDENNVLSTEAKNALQEAMRQRVIQRALDFLGAKYEGTNTQLDAPKAGAPVLAAELRKCPNPWCQAGAAVVDVAHAIFGGSESIQSFVQNQALESTEQYSSNNAYEFVTDLAFSIN